MIILLLGLATTIGMVALLYQPQIHLLDIISPLIALLTLWVWTCLSIVPWSWRRIAHAPALYLRQHVSLLWLALLFGPLAILIIAEQARMTSDGRWPFYLLAHFWALALSTLAGSVNGDWRAVGQRLRQNRWSGALIALTTFVIIAIVFELSLRTVFIFTNTYAVGPIHRQWMERYWRPINRIGYRDYDFVPRPGTQQHIIVVGDSFTAGLGITDIDNTFPHILERSLGIGHQVNIVAQPGWNTDAQLAALHGFPFPPNVVILSYFLNDIAYWDAKANYYFNEIYPLPPLAIRSLVDNFHLPSFLYWNVYQQLLRGGEINYANSIQRAFQEPDIWNFHSRDLAAMHEWALEHDAQFIVIIWPFLTDVKASEPMANQVEVFMLDRGVPVINLAHDLRDKPPLTLIANPFDMHPNEDAHRLAAQKLYELLSQN